MWGQALPFCVLGLLVLAATATYMGCYKDDEARHFKVWQNNSDVMTTSACILSCKKDGYKFAGLQAGRYCFCGDRLQHKDYPKMQDAECSNPCTGNSDIMCGGEWRNSVYMTGYVDEPCNAEVAVLFDIQNAAADSFDKMKEYTKGLVGALLDKSDTITFKGVVNFDDDGYKNEIFGGFTKVEYTDKIAKIEPTGAPAPTQSPPTPSDQSGNE